MLPEPETTLKQQIRGAGYSMREMAHHVDTPYGTFASWMNGFSPLPTNVRFKINQLIGSVIRTPEQVSNETHAIA